MDKLKQMTVVNGCTKAEADAAAKAIEGMLK